ncbi:arginase [Bacteroidia bacterium]|nr:arginase [Bacteroidia bacterium]
MRTVELEPSKGFDWEWLQDFKIGLVGLRPAGVPHSFSPLRESLYSLYLPQKKISIIDLGDIEIVNGNPEENTEKVACALQQIFRQGTFPLVFTENMRYSYWVYAALKNQFRSISAAYILPHANLGNPHEPLTEQNVVGHTFADLTRELSHLSLLGYQSYLTNFKDVQLLDKNYCETMRLGVIRDDIQRAEPLLRDAMLLCASVNALRQSDAPAATQPSPNGFYTEEMCRLLRFAAFSNELRACCIGGFNFVNDLNAQTTNLVAQLLWHVIEGIANRVKEHPLNNKNNCRCHQVEMGKDNQQIVFYQGNITQRWWMEVPSAGKEQNRVIACSQSDYKQAAHGEIPDRWLWFFKKFAQ